MKPVSAACAAIVEARRHAVIGVSPFNSYFSEARLEALFGWAERNFERFDVFVPDEAARFTLEAMGYPPSRARKKAHRRARYLGNKILRALDRAVAHPEAVRVWNHESLSTSDPYRRLLAETEARFESDAQFRAACMDCSRWVLEAQSDAPPSEETLLRAVDYFLAEMPFFMDSAAIAGAASSVFCYHQCPGSLRLFYTDRPAGLIADRRAFLVVDTPAPTPAAPSAISSAS